MLVLKGAPSVTVVFCNATSAARAFREVPGQVPTGSLILPFVMSGGKKGRVCMSVELELYVFNGIIIPSAVVHLLALQEQ